MPVCPCAVSTATTFTSFVIVYIDCKAAVYTWYGCKLETNGNCSVAYVSDETPMISCMNIHAQLESRREEAASRSTASSNVFFLIFDYDFQSMALYHLK